MLFLKYREKMVGENLREGSMEVAFELWIEQRFLSSLQRKFPPLSREAKTFQNLASEEQVWKKFSFWRIKMKKKLIIGIVIVAVLVACMIVFVILFKKTNMVSISRNEITSVVITDGNNGDMIELSAEEMDTLIKLCERVECKKVSRGESGGWSYSIDIAYGNKSNKITVISNEVCKIGNDSYKINKQDGDEVIRIIKKFYMEK